MKRETKKLLKENGRREKLLSPASQTAMTESVVILRGCDLSMPHLEVVRRDIQEIGLEAEGRGETMDSVIGGDYRAFCDEIVSALPPRSRKEKVLEQADILLSAWGILMVIWLVKSLVEILLAGGSDWHVTLTAGQLISWGIILVVAEAVVWWVTRTAFDRPAEGGTAKQFVKIWVIIFLVLAAILLPSVYLTSPAVAIPLAGAVVLTLLPYGGMILLRNL